MTTQKTVNDLAYGSLTEVSALIRRREISPIDLVRACRERIERLQPQLNAFITIMSEEAMRDAKRADAEIHRGQWKGALHGIPIGIKDFFDTAGVKTTAAFAPFRNRIPGGDAASVARLKRRCNCHRQDEYAHTGNGNHRTHKLLWAGPKSLECRLHTRRIVQRIGERGGQRDVLRHA
jgi:hypothetical protein